VVVATTAHLQQEWKHHLRSAIHPAIFALAYELADTVAAALSLDARLQSELLLVAPRIVQALLSATCDFYTWKLARSLYGLDSAEAFCALILTTISPWQWFCSTRTFSNCLETTLTIIALYCWPWQWTLDNDKKASANFSEGSSFDVTAIRRALLCAALAVVLRPTNILVWIILGAFALCNRRDGTFIRLSVLGREALLCGSAILVLSTVVDRTFYGEWVFPPLNFFKVNVLQSIAGFYGNNDWHYYMSQGYPLLLTTALPFTLIGMWKRLRRGTPVVGTGVPCDSASTVLRQLAWVCLLVPAAFSLISHKEVRFIYPLLPALHVVAASPAAEFFAPLFEANFAQKLSQWLTLFLIVSLNVSIAYYTSQIHNSGIPPLTDYLRSEFITHYSPQQPARNMTVGFVMPCHSTPWRSHLQHPASLAHTGIKGWALTCEPPLDMNATEKAGYLDEADQFYANPSLWTKKSMARQMPTSHASSPGFFAKMNYGKVDTIDSDVLAREREDHFWATGAGRKPWPDYLMFFEQLEPTMQTVLRGSAYGECQRFFNSHWHDDWRRQGDIVVWCLHVEKQKEWSRKQLSRAGIGMERVEEALRDPTGAVGDDTGMKDQKILAEIGERKVKATPRPQETKEPFRRVVEKPFWKHRGDEL
jgi:GPI mannosyltransferase 3